MVFTFAGGAIAGWRARGQASMMVLFVFNHETRLWILKTIIKELGIIKFHEMEVFCDIN
jgi:hypothetical protein